MNVLKIISILGILTLGISHGSIDDVLHFKNLKVKKGYFVFKYLFIIFVNTIVWYLLPNLAVLGFILISGFHFGQAQFIDYKLTKKIASNLTYASWGNLVLFLFFYCNSHSLQMYGNQYYQIPELLLWFIQNAGYFLIFFAVILFSNFAYFSIKKEISLQSIIIELLLLFVISSSFLLIDPLIAFSLFFIILHSYQVMIHEINYLDLKNNFDFIKMLIPLTIISLVGIAIILSVLFFTGLEYYIPLVLIIMISSVTTPHSFIMNKFYSSNNKYHANFK